MKQETFADVVELSGVQLRVNTGGGKYSCYLEILRAIEDQLSAMLSHHSRVLVLRLDLHREGYSRDNLEVSRFMEKIRHKLREHYKAKRLGYVWVREQERAKRQHYHLALMIDANKIQHPGRLIDWIGRRWESRGHPKPYTPKNCFKVVSREAKTGYLVVFERLSYLAKTRGKGYREQAVNDYSASRIKPKDLIKPKL